MLFTARALLIETIRVKVKFESALDASDLVGTRHIVGVYYRVSIAPT